MRPRKIVAISSTEVTAGGITIWMRCDRVRCSLALQEEKYIVDNGFGEQFRTRRVGERRSRFSRSSEDLTRLRGSGESDENVFERVPT